MAIIIPSKNIYEINNQKVVDNEVDNIEVEAKNVAPSNEFDTPVYNENFDVKENTQTINHEKSDKADKDYLGSGGGYHDYIRLASTSQLSLTYKTIPEIRIKKLRGKDIISQIYYKTDDEGNPNIKYTLTAKIQTTNNFGIGYNPSTDTFNFYENLAPIDEEKNAYSYKDIDFSKTNRETVDINPPTTAVLQTELSAKVNGNIINTKASIVGIGSPPFDSIGKNSAVSEIAVPVEEILSFDSVEEVVNEKEEYYVIKGIKICVGVLCKLGYAYIISSTPQSELGEGGGLYVKGAIIKIVPSSVQVTIYGDTIGIDLQDETVKIGDGQHVYSFDGNELMQTSNTPKIQNGYEKIIESWSSGKETATIKCGISDYYETKSREINENIELRYYRANSAPPRHEFYYPSDKSILKGDKLIFSADGETYTLTVYQIVVNLSIGRLIYCTGTGKFIADNIYIAELVRETSLAISPKKEYGTNMLFHIGDIVIPYIKGADGQDKPISYYMDRTTPKEFLVIGKGITADGEILQELTLQEVTQN